MTYKEQLDACKEAGASPIDAYVAQRMLDEIDNAVYEGTLDGEITRHYDNFNQLCQRAYGLYLKLEQVSLDDCIMLVIKAYTKIKEALFDMTEYEIASKYL